MYTLASSWCVCTGSGGVLVVAPGVGALADGRGGFCAAGPGLVASWEALAPRDHELW